MRHLRNNSKGFCLRCVPAAGSNHDLSCHFFIDGNSGLLDVYNQVSGYRGDKKLGW